MLINKKNYEIIAEEIERMIIEGILQPGDKLDTIENLAKQYHVGRSTIREALSHLKARGLVETVQGGGVYVTRTFHKLDAFASINLADPTELFQLLQVRKIIEVGCIELAAQARTDEDLEEMERILQQMKGAEGNEEISQIYDVNFHVAIAKATQNPLLQTMMENLSVTMSRTIRDSRKLWLHSEANSAARLLAEHQQMWQAIRDQDSETAVEIMKQHIGKVEAVLVGQKKP